jgi:hypothetical protein
MIRRKRGVVTIASMCWLAFIRFPMCVALASNFDPLLAGGIAEKAVRAGMFMRAFTG